VHGDLFKRVATFVFTARCYASAVYAVVVCLCVCPAHAGIVSKRLNVGSRKQLHVIAQGFYTLSQKGATLTITCLISKILSLLQRALNFQQNPY